MTVFLGNLIMYLAFLILFTYVLLMDFREPPPHGPGAPEIMLYFWVSTLVLEEIRQVNRLQAKARAMLKIVTVSCRYCSLLVLFLCSVFAEDS